MNWVARRKESHRQRKVRGGAGRWLATSLLVLVAGKASFLGYQAFAAGGVVTTGAGSAADVKSKAGEQHAALGPIGGAEAWREKSSGSIDSLRKEVPAVPEEQPQPVVQSRPSGSTGTSGKPVKSGAALEARSLLDAIARRQGELDAREEAVNAREEKLKVFEEDVTRKIAALEELEKTVSTKMAAFEKASAARSKADGAAADAAAESLAKVYAAMEAAKAAPILENLDDATVLRILGKMKEKQVGEILPFMSRDKAVVLTRALSERRS